MFYLHDSTCLSKPSSKLYVNCNDIQTKLRLYYRTTTTNLNTIKWEYANSNTGATKAITDNLNTIVHIKGAKQVNNIKYNSKKHVSSLKNTDWTVALHIDFVVSRDITVANCSLLLVGRDSVKMAKVLKI